jgi:hypothetical protein
MHSEGITPASFSIALTSDTSSSVGEAASVDKGTNHMIQTETNKKYAVTRTQRRNYSRTAFKK